MGLMVLGLISFVAYLLVHGGSQSVIGLMYLGMVMFDTGFIWQRSYGGLKYVVRIGNASGEVDGIVSKDQ